MHELILNNNEVTFKGLEKKLKNLYTYLFDNKIGSKPYYANLSMCPSIPV